MKHEIPVNPNINQLGKLRTLSAGTRVKSLALQEVVKFDRDLIVEVTAIVIDDPNLFSGKIKMIFDNRRILDKKNGDLEAMKFDQTEEFHIIPKKRNC